MKNKYYYFIFCLILTVLAFISGCGSNSTGGGGGGGGGISNRPGTYAYSGTQSPGDIWTWIISSETFFGTNETTGFWITGEWTILSSGFSKARIFGSSVSEVVSQDAYFLEFPDTLLLVQPASTNETRENVITCAARSTDQPQGDKKYVAVNIPGKYWKVEPGNNWKDKMDAYGYVYLNVRALDTDPWQLDMTNFILDGSIPTTGWDATGETYLDGRFSGGHITSSSYTSEVSAPDVSDLTVFLTPSKIYLGDYGPDMGGFVGVYVDPINLFDSFEAAAHEFRGYEFKYFAESGTGETHPIALSSNPSAPGTLKIRRYENDDVESSLSTSNEATFALGIQSIDTWIISSEMTDDKGETPAKTGMAKVGSAQKYVFFSVGAYPDGNPINLFIVQSD